MSTSTKTEIDGDASGAVSLATLALVSTYIADERPEGDTLGKWAEVAQVFSVGLLILAAIFALFVFLFALLKVVLD